jgi:S1-C subfamily serine protease
METRPGLSRCQPATTFSHSGQRAKAAPILRRFTKNNVQHPTYKALCELGKALKTVFLCEYLLLESLRHEIHEGLQVIETWNSANDFILYGKKLLTNYHVIADGQKIIAKSGAERYRLKSVLVADKDHDVAELEFAVSRVPYLKLGSSSYALQGERVLVIGKPMGLESTVSDGIISAFRAGRTMIQITAPISPGSRLTILKNVHAARHYSCSCQFSSGWSCFFRFSNSALTANPTADFTTSPVMNGNTSIRTGHSL